MSKKKEKQGAKKILDSVNDLFSVISDVANDEGFQVPDLHLNSLAVLHRELLNKVGE